MVSTGFVIAAAGIALVIQAGTDSLAVVVAAWTIVSIGMAPAFTVTADLIITAAPPERAGSAAAMSETGNELGGALGVAVIGSIGTAVYRSSVSDAMPAGVPAEAAHAATDTLGGALAAAASLPAETGAALLNVAQNAFVDGLQLTAVISTVVVIATAAVAVLALRNLRPGGGHEMEEDVTIDPAPAPAREPVATPVAVSLEQGQ